MPLVEDVTRRPQINNELITLSRVHQLSFFLRIAVASANDSFRQVLSETIGPDIHEFGCEIGVNCRRFCIQLNSYRSRHLEIASKCDGRENQNVLSSFGRPLIPRP